MEYLFDLNLDQPTRDLIIWGDLANEWGDRDLRHFTDLTLDQMGQLLSQNFVSLDLWNGAPGAKYIYDWAVENSSDCEAIHFIGYAINLDREDYRVAVDGIKALGCSQSFREAFRAKWGSDEDADDEEGYSAADDLEVSPEECRAWWD